MTSGSSDCREGAKRCDKENQRGWGRGELLPLLLSLLLFPRSPTLRCTPLSERLKQAQ